MAQPARVFNSEIEKQIVKEVEKLLAASFIKPIQHPWWLANIVPMKKKNKQIQCCVDFRNLNRICSKDEFPLLNMDLLIDSAIGNAMFFFYGWIQRVQLNSDGTKGCGKNCFQNTY